ncbi:MAG: hypothetical protein B7Z66_06915 [Chromatiales bacterium 21-64-14]|nr:MAG: hypothetical protein B7Z66_06915 [Chromatiales bacterium 21-64-14]HQU16831.1 PilN domain-containing protein [Gammaproteobacteria bacterium]
MARINLLPWRDELRKERQREFIIALVGAAVLAGLVVLLIQMRISGMIGYQNNRNEYLQQQTAELDKRIHKIQDLESTKKKLLARMDIIQRLQHSRPEIVHLFNEIATTLPDGVYVTSITQQGTNLTFKGVAQSNSRVSAYMRNLAASKWLTNPRLEVIHTKPVAGLERDSDFTLQVSQVVPKVDEEHPRATKRKHRRGRK